MDTLPVKHVRFHAHTTAHTNVRDGEVVGLGASATGHNPPVKYVSTLTRCSCAVLGLSPSEPQTALQARIPNELHTPRSPSPIRG